MSDVIEGKPEEIDVAYVAHLARLELTAAETALFQDQLDHVLAYVRKIGELDLEGIEPTSHARPVYNVLRKDETREELDRDTVLDNAPAQVKHQFMVPKIVE